MTWRQTRQEKEPASLSTSLAMFNRAALNPARLRIHSRMIREGRNRSEDGRLVAGCLAAVLVKEFAQEAGKPTPLTLDAAVDFLRRELKGFDSPEATDGEFARWEWRFGATSREILRSRNLMPHSKDSCRPYLAKRQSQAILDFKPARLVAIVRRAGR
jgi:hypothetical protein